MPFSLTAQPVVGLPAAWSADGLPAGVPVVAPNFLQHRVLAAARQIEQRSAKTGPA